MTREDNLEPVLEPSILESILDPVLELIMSLAEAYVLSKVEPYNCESVDDPMKDPAAGLLLSRTSNDEP